MSCHAHTVPTFLFTGESNLDYSHLFLELVQKNPNQRFINVGLKATPALREYDTYRYHTILDDYEIMIRTLILQFDFKALIHIAPNGNYNDILQTPPLVVALQQWNDVLREHKIVVISKEQFTLKELEEALQSASGDSIEEALVYL